MIVSLISRRGGGSSMNFSTAGRLSTTKRDDSTIQDESMDGEESKLE